MVRLRNGLVLSAHLRFFTLFSDFGGIRFREECEFSPSSLVLDSKISSKGFSVLGILEIL